MIRSLLKRLYQLIPFKKELFILLKKFYKPSSSIYQHLHFKGKFSVPVNDTTFHMYHYGYEIENEVFWNGIFDGWEKVSLAIWSELSSKSDIILDIGANTGIYTLLARSANPSAEIHAFEPVSRIYEKLRRNINLNSMTVSTHEKAVSNNDGTAYIFDPGLEHLYSVKVNENLAGDNYTEQVEIETIRLDTYIDAEKLEKIDLIKVDVETHEPEVLEGLGEYLSLFQPSMLIEILNDDVATRIEKMIHSLGYEYYNIHEGGTIRKVDHLSKSDYYNFLICKPEISAQLNSIRRYGVEKAVSF